LDFAYFVVCIFFCELIFLALPLFHGEHELEAETDACIDDDSRGKCPTMQYFLL
jgi:hypothetical protein